MKKVVFLLLVVLSCFMFFGCTTDASVASHNLSKAADQFEIYRRVVFYNGITDEYILMVEGYCSVGFYDDKFVVMVKTDSGEFIKHYLGRADNVFHFVEQIEPKKVSDAKYRVIFKPSAIIPNVDIE